MQADGVWMITGGAGALAEEVARVLGAAGATPVPVDLEGDALRARAAQLGALPVAADLTDAAACQAAATEAPAARGPIAGLVHTAGASAKAGAAEGDPGLHDRMLDVNLRTLVNTTRAVLPGMLARRSGFIARISSSVVWHATRTAGMSLQMPAIALPFASAQSL